MISLTFDNGPDPEVTPIVLDTLLRFGVEATFFVNGKNLTTRAGQELIHRARREGHAVGNHTFSHDRPLGAMDSGAAAIEEIARTQELLGDVSTEDKLFRPSAGGGFLNSLVLCSDSKKYLIANKFSCVTWNCVPRDWEDPIGWVDQALSFAAGNVWTVLILHDIPQGGTKRLGDFIIKARGDLGVEFSTAFPIDCAPIWRGKERWDVSPLVTQR